ncbi:MAG TPA: helix-hairpin-helix domain-containing protein [Acidobacteriota bacterium]|nr:helix-hairpin-helix domain-containing protein [Acidobacteriota bacterium]
MASKEAILRKRPPRRLEDLYSVGRKTLEDFRALGIHNLEQLSCQDASELYEKLCQIAGKRVDPCCRDVFRCAIEQARDPDLPMEKRAWWYWTRERKAKG